MKLRLLDLLVCPIDKSRLELIEWETVPVALPDREIQRIRAIGLDPALYSKEVLTGVLVNRARKIFYPIHRGVPRLLIFPTELTRKFAGEYTDRLARTLPGLNLPHETPPPGEEDVLRSFSNEWVNYNWDSMAYWNLSSEDWNGAMRFLLDLDHRPIKQNLVLEVGIGIGGTADYISRSEECEMVGIDLSYAVDAAYKNFGQNPLLHIVQASLFFPPFQENTFDFVYSHGVIMATYSTKEAFDRLARLPKIGGRYYIWVYSPYDEERTLERRLLLRMEQVIRPIIWRLPENLQTLALRLIAPLYIVRQNVFMRRRDRRYAKYGWREAMHAARDRFTVRYAYRHTEEEVCSWFRQAGYTELQCVSRRKRPEFIPTSLVAATAVDGIRRDLKATVNDTGDSS